MDPVLIFVSVTEKYNGNSFNGSCKILEISKTKIDRANVKQNSIDTDTKGIAMAIRLAASIINNVSSLDNIYQYQLSTIGAYQNGNGTGHNKNSNNNGFNE